ncbi:MAG: LuxR C-terminal-related transcriptional regulator [Roseovarius sp.]
MSNGESLKPARAVEALLGRGFPGHTMQRVRTPDGRYRYGYVGAGVRDLFGLDPDDLMQRSEVDHAWVHPEDRPRFLEALETSAAELTPLDEEVRVERPEGGYRWVRSVGHPRARPDGSIIWDGVALDIHDRKEALETLSTMLARVRDSETTEDRFSAIAAQDLQERLHETQAALARMAAQITPGQRPAFAALEAQFAALSSAILAGQELVDTADRAGRPVPMEAETGGAPRLTGRQLEILQLVAMGASNRDIGARLGLSEGTVKQHLSRIYKRLGVTSRTEAISKVGRGVAGPF